LVTALAMPFKAEINQNGAIAQVKIESPGQVEMVMERSEGSDWRVTTVRDQELAGRVLKGIVTDLPRLKSPLDQIQKLPETLQKLPLLN
jgi:Tfp pilus assembly ATPase PilU